MTENLTKEKEKSKIKFPPVYWLVIIFEFFERGSYYGMMSILAVYLTDKLNFSVTEAGSVLGIIQPIVYFLPILTGAIADKVGYRRMLILAFGLLGIGYFFVSQSTEYLTIFASLTIMAFGAGTFKPIISGTIAKVTNESNSSVGFGIFYWSINLGAFLFPLFIVPFLKQYDWSYVFIASGICTGLLLLPTIFLYKEPEIAKEKKKEPIAETIISIFKKIVIVILDWRFMLFILIYSLFWVLYFQMFGTVLWYVQLFVDATPLNNFISNLFGINWVFDIEHVTVINAFTIILLQLIISKIVKKAKAIPTIITGIAIATFGMFLLSFSSNIWVFALGLVVFSLGEMTAHPKYISYLGLIAPEDKKATYLGFGFLYGVFGSFVGSILGSNLYNSMVNLPILNFIKLTLGNAGIALPESVSLAEALRAAEEFGINKAEILMQSNPSGLWLIFSGIGMVGIAGLVFYIKVIAKKKES
jgi:dipeptide/tripeptide permease